MSRIRVRILLVIAALCAPLAHHPAAAATQAADFVPAIEEALAEKGAPADARATLAAPEQPLPLNPQIESVSYNPSSGRFAVRISGAAGTGVAIVVGEARPPVLAPVLVAPVARGETIRSENVAVINVAAGAAPQTAVLDAHALIGAEARRDLAAATPLRRSDIARPFLVQKNQPVTVLFERPGLTLSQTGVARTSGAKGDVVEIEAAGGRIVGAVVIGPQAASVGGRRFAARSAE